MRTTNKEHIILKEKLQGVDRPDMDKAWEKMDRALESPPATGVVSSFLGKFKLYLNLFVGAVLISAVAIFVASKPKKDIAHPTTDILPLIHETGLNQLIQPALYVDHQNDLPLLRLNEVEEPKQIIPSIHTRAINVVQPATITIDRVPIVVPNIAPRSFIFPFDTILSSFDFEGETILGFKRVVEPSRFKKRYHRNQVGVKIQTIVLPEFNSQNIINNVGASMFGRKYFNSRTALHLELGYNPIAIRPVTYIETYKIFNNINYSQTDSARVTSLKYVSIPVCLYYQITDHISMNIGPQISFLTGLQGDLNRRLIYPGAPENEKTIEQTTIQNRGGFAKKDLSFVVEFNYRYKRLEAGVKLQQGVTDYSTTKINTSTHRLNSLQLKAAWILN